MYSQLDKVFLFGMDYVVRPPQLVLFPKSLKKDDDDEEEEEEKAMGQQSKVLHEGEDDNFTLPTSLPHPPPSLSTSSQDDQDHGHETKMTREVEVLYKKNTINTDDDDDDDDDGYHTPTSPRHRIPAVLECPPVPRKHWRQQQQQRRKRGRAVCLCLVAEIDGDDDMLAAKAKKARD